VHPSDIGTTAQPPVTVHQVAKQHKSTCQVDACLAGRTLRAIVDTGANSNAVTIKCLKSTGLLQLITPEPAPYINADGRTILSAGMVYNLPFSIGELDAEADFMVTEADNYDMLFGTNVLNTIDARINFAKRAFTCRTNNRSSQTLDLHLQPRVNVPKYYAQTTGTARSPTANTQDRTAHHDHPGQPCEYINMQACTPTEVGEGDTRFEAIQTVDDEDIVQYQNNEIPESHQGNNWNPKFQALQHVLSPLLPAAPAVATRSMSATASFYAAWFRQYSNQVSHAHVQAMEEVLSLAKGLNQLVESRMIRVRDDVLALPCFQEPLLCVLQVPTYSCLLNALAAEAKELSPSTSDPADIISQGSCKPAMPAAAAVHKAFGAKAFMKTTVHQSAPPSSDQHLQQQANQQMSDHCEHPEACWLMNAKPLTPGNESSLTAPAELLP
jgi:hypothetical protein